MLGAGRYRSLADGAGTAAWLLSDTLWATGHPVAACLAMGLALALHAGRLYPDRDSAARLAAMLWILANWSWVAEDAAGWPWLTQVKIWSFGLAWTLTAGLGVTGGTRLLAGARTGTRSKL